MSGLSRRPLPYIRDQALRFRTAELRRAFAKGGQRDRRSCYARLERTELNGLFQYVTAAVRAGERPRRPWHVAVTEFLSCRPVWRLTILRPPPRSCVRCSGSRSVDEPGMGLVLLRRDVVGLALAQSAARPPGDEIAAARTSQLGQEPRARRRP
jgi:hypothetical protein